MNRMIRGGIVALLGLLLVACGGGNDGTLGGRGTTADPAGAQILGPSEVLRGDRIEWTVHMPGQPADDAPDGYAIDLPESASRIRIDVAPCAAPATTGCQRWTIDVARDAVPGDHSFQVRPVGLRTATRDVTARLVILAPATHHGRAEGVADDGDTVIVAARSRDGALRLVGRGDNRSGLLASGYPKPLSISATTTVIGPGRSDAFIALERAPDAGSWDQLVMGSGSVLARSGTRVYAWGDASEQGLGRPGDVGDVQLVPRILEEFDGAVAVAESSRRAGVVGAEGHVRVRLILAREVSHRLVKSHVVDSRGVPLGGVVQALDAGHTLLMLQGDGSLWRLLLDGRELAERLSGLPGGLVALAGAGDAVVARDAAGRLWWWRQGERDTAPALQPVPAIDAVTSHSVDANGRAHAVRSDGTVWSWPLGGTPARVGTLTHARSVSGSGWVITGHCSEGDGGLWKIEPAATPPVQRQPGFGDDCDGAPAATTVLIVSVVGNGSVTSVPSGLACGRDDSCGAAFAAGSTVELQAFGAEGRRVRDWSGDCITAPSTPGRAQVTMPAAATRRAVCTVSFEDVPPPRLQVSISGPGQVELQGPAGVTTLCLRDRTDVFGDCQRGLSPVTLTARPDPGAVFTGWLGACSGTSATLVQVVVGAQSCTATFADEPRTLLAVTVEGAGSVASTPAGIDCGTRCTAALPVGSTVTLVATPAAGQRVAGWSGDCAGSAATVTITLAAPRRCTVRFEPDAVPPAPPPPLPADNLVRNPGFESPVGAGTLPVAAGLWAGDATSLSAGEGGVVPHGGRSMLKFVATGPSASAALLTSQLWQIVDLSEWSAAIARGDVRADASAWFHRVVGTATTDRRFDLRVLAYDGPPAELPVRYAANRALALQAAVVDSAGVAWQQASASLLLPPGTRYVLVEIYAYEDVRNDAVAPEFDGHYADDVALVLRRP